MVKRQKISDDDVITFSWLLTKWSENNNSCFLRQFWKGLGMTEMQFYRRIWIAQTDKFDFSFDYVTKNLKRNKDYRSFSLHPKKTDAKIEREQDYENM